MLDEAKDESAEPGAPTARGAMLDVAIIGAGLSGVCAGAHLAQSRPQDEFLIFEAREAIGGTWDLFRYPGIRSDSDMFTLGFSFRPWTDGKAIADGPSILNYVRETAEAYGLDKRMRFGRKAVSAAWSSEEACWTLRFETAEGVETARARFLMLCTGYYDYDGGYTPEFAGSDTFQGQIVHPQKWPEGLDLKDKKVVIIGSGATAVTLAPAIAQEGAQVAMVQRTPTYVMDRPAEDRFVNFVRRVLPKKAAYGAARVKNIAESMLTFQLAKLRPRMVRNAVIKNAKEHLGEEAGVETHFSPPYDPWDQRFCIAPDGDFFKAMAAGDVTLVTGAIERFTPKGLRIASGERAGEEIEADIIVTATGLVMKLAGGMTLSVDGREHPVGDTISYRGAMFSGAPNLAATFGYTNASWTLKCELIVRWVIRLLNHMEAKGLAVVTPTPPSDLKSRDLVNLSSGYIARAKGVLPQQGDRGPWRVRQNYLRDLIGFRLSKVEAEGLRFSGARPSSTGAADQTEATPGAALTDARS
ncbi:MAG: NAD(P)/FAD-dependent oxidoreductase [Pseudomonadota bacterium]